MAKASPSDKSILIDCFAGVGGNVIAFARSDRWRRVYAIEKDPKTLACAKHNARIYGVQDRISWYQGDCFSLLNNELIDLGAHAVVFASPPWGGKSVVLANRNITEPLMLVPIGPSYRSDALFDLSKMQPYTLLDLLRPIHQFTCDITLYLPRTSDMRQLASHTHAATKTTVVHYCMEGASKVRLLVHSPYIMCC